KLGRRRERRDRSLQVAVLARTAEQRAELRDDVAGVQAGERAEHAAARLAELEDRDAATGAHHARELAQRGSAIRDIADPERDRRRVDLAIAMRQALRVAHLE